MAINLRSLLLTIGALALFATGCGKDPVSYKGTSKGDTLAIQAILAANGLADSFTVSTITMLSDWNSSKRLFNLRLSSKGLVVLPKEIGDLTALEQLNLASNNLTSLPNEIGNLKLLEGLNVADNQLTTLPTTIGDCDSLRTLLIQDNELTTLPSTIVNLTHLDFLNLDNNRLVNETAQIKDFVNSLNLGDSTWISTQRP